MHESTATVQMIGPGVGVLPGSLGGDRLRWEDSRRVLRDHLNCTIEICARKRVAYHTLVAGGGAPLHPASRRIRS